MISLFPTHVAVNLVRFAARLQQKRLPVYPEGMKDSSKAETAIPLAMAFRKVFADKANSKPEEWRHWYWT